MRPLICFSFPLRVLVLLACLLAWAYIELSTPGLSRRASLTSVKACTFPPLATVAAAWAQEGFWYSAPHSGWNRLYSWEEAITIHVGNSERYIDGCGHPTTREGTLRQRWGFNATLRPPYLPAFPAWSRTLTCQALRGRSIIVVGDSLSNQFYDALVSALWSGEMGVRPAERQPSTQVCDGREDGGQPLAAHFVYFDHLSDSAAGEASFQQQVLAPLEARLAALAAASAPPPIVIFNRGAHMYSSEVERASVSSAGGESLLTLPGAPEAEARDHASINARHLARLQALWQWARRALPTSPVFWRTTNVGHPFCRHTVLALPAQRYSNLTELQAQRGPGAAPLQDLPDSDYRSAWHWDLILPQNAATLAALPSSVHLLDVAPGASLRHDSHPHFKYGKKERQDCLHYCLPGPIDTWVELFAASVRYGEGGGSEFFGQEALHAMCQGGGGGKLPVSQHELRAFGSR
jgi:hypothetical protein